MSFTSPEKEKYFFLYLWCDCEAKKKNALYSTTLECVSRGTQKPRRFTMDWDELVLWNLWCPRRTGALGCSFNTHTSQVEHTCAQTHTHIHTRARTNIHMIARSHACTRAHTNIHGHKLPCVCTHYFLALSHSLTRPQTTAVSKRNFEGVFKVYHTLTSTRHSR